jgi:hypothetical protein
MVDIIIGPTRKAFKVHKKLLCTKITHFQRLFKSGMIEYQTSTITMPEANESAFTLLIGWVYTNAIPETTRPRLDALPMEINEQLVARMKLYFLAEELLITDLLDATMNSISHAYARLGTWDLLVPAANLDLAVLCFENTKPSSPLRLFMARSVQCGIHVGHFTNEAIVRAFAQSPDLLDAFITEIRINSDVEYASNLRFSGRLDFHSAMTFEDCEYHTHDDGPVCPLDCSPPTFGSRCKTRPRPIGDDVGHNRNVRKRGSNQA